VKKNKLTATKDGHRCTLFFPGREDFECFEKHFLNHKHESLVRIDATPIHVPPRRKSLQQAVDWMDILSLLISSGAVAVGITSLREMVRDYLKQSQSKIVIVHKDKKIELQFRDQKTLRILASDESFRQHLLSEKEGQDP
jgi:hypothetical protein